MFANNVIVAYRNPKTAAKAKMSAINMLNIGDLPDNLDLST